MKLSKYTIFILIIVCLPFCFLIAEEFIIKRDRAKTRNKISKRVYQERGATHMGDMMQILPNILRSVADIQQTLLEHLHGFLEGDKSCYMLNCSKNELVVFEEKLAVSVKQLQDIQAQLIQIVTKVSS
jgi:hypothetical protein